MRSNSEDTSSFNQHFKSGRFSAARMVLSGDVAITTNGSLVNHLDPGVSARVVELPPMEFGRFYVVNHVGAAGSLQIETATGSVVATLLAGENVILFASDSEWSGIKSLTDLSDFGIAGPEHKRGLVPDPGPTPGVDASHRRYLSELGWAEITEISGDDFFKYFTDGTNTQTPLGADTLTFTSANNRLTVAAAAKAFTFTVNEANINHNALLNYVADQHVAHSGVTLTAGNGLVGGGTIAASRTFDLDLNDLNTDTPVLTDTFAFYDVSGTDTNKATLAVLNGILDHNGLLNYSANRHIDHTGVSIVTAAGSGLSGGGDISASRTLSVDITGLTLDNSPATNDELMFYDVSAVERNKMTVAGLNAILAHDSLAGYSANRHIDHTGVTLTAGAGLTGGGDISASRSFAVGAGQGITVNADDVALNVNGLTQDTAPDVLADFFLSYDTSAGVHKKILLTTVVRDRLTANRTYYLNASTGNDSNDGSVGSPKLTMNAMWDFIADKLDLNGFRVDVMMTGAFTAGLTTSKGLVGDNGLSAVRFLGSLAPNSTVTITIATPGVITWNAHGRSANDPIVLVTLGTLPTGLTNNGVVFVSASGLGANSFQVSATPGGAVINTTGAQSGTHFAYAYTAPTVTVTTAGDCVSIGASAFGRTAVTFGGIKFVSTGANGINISGPCGVAIGVLGYPVEFGACLQTHYITNHSGAQAYLGTHCRVSGGAGTHCAAYSNSTNAPHNLDIIFTGAMAFNYFAYVEMESALYVTNMRFHNAGSVTGPRFFAGAGAHIYASGAKGSYLPGNASGVEYEDGGYVNTAAGRTGLTAHDLGVRRDIAYGQIPATATNDNAAAGCVGEHIQGDLLAGSKISLTTGVVANIVSIPLTAGDWDVDAWCNLTPGATTNFVSGCLSISFVSATHNFNAFHWNQIIAPTPAGSVINNNFNFVTPSPRILLSAPATLYLVVSSNFTVSTMQAYGSIRARRPR